MSALKSLTFTTLPKIGANPTLDRRTNMIARLEEQKVLLKDPNYIRTVRTCSDHCGAQWRAGRSTRAGEETSDGHDDPQGGVNSRARRQACGQCMDGLHRSTSRPWRR